MEHKHKADIYESKKIVGGGAIGMEQCCCGAMRSVIKNEKGATITSDWCTEDSSDTEVTWGPHNDNGGTDD